MFLYLLSWISSFLLVAVCVFSLAAGIYQLAELVEEYTVTAKKIIVVLFWISAAGMVGAFLFEGFPLSAFLCGGASHICYFIILGSFPFISMMSPAFLASIALLFLNHYLLLSHFETVWYPFSEIIAYVVISVWMVPFALFISLSANDYVLPTMTSPTSAQPPPTSGHGGRSSNKRAGVKALMDSLLTYLPTAKKHF
ncbi:protein TEX261-like [Sycon ciliatum]|uniref:protein TEX261-like n=1 Tax=Sycon ciliatum TaxID=27933 RepID=UPI0020AB21FD|eukprot:scpid26924/ scgid34215/ Protein TEX261